MDTNFTGSTMDTSFPVSGSGGDAHFNFPKLTEYQPLGEIGVGGMGVVFQAIHRKLKRPVAIKFIPAHRRQTEAAVESFHLEMEAIGRLDHPNIVRAYDAGNFEGIDYLVMEYVDGVDLAALVHGRGALPYAQACDIARQVAVALEHLHSSGLVHRDIKPSNILLSYAGQVKLADLGLAGWHVSEKVEPSPGGSQRAVGTIDYMAPEQADASSAPDIRADLYSLGCTLYFLLTGRPPFGEMKSVTKKLKAHAEAPPRPLQSFRDDLPGPVVAIVNRLLAKTPEGRFATPAEVARALAPWTQADGTSVGVSDDDTLNDLSALTKDLPPARSTEVAGFSPTTPWYSSAGSRVASETSAKRRRPSEILLGAAGIALLAALVVIAYGFGDQTAGPSPMRPEVIEYPGMRVDTVPAWYTDEDEKELTVEADDPALLQMGTLGQGTHTISMEIRQADWAGDVGIFVGYHRVLNDFGRPCGSFQRIWLQRILDETGKPDFRMFRRWSVIDPDSLMVSGDYDFAWPVAMPEPNEWRRLEIEFDERGIRKIFWGDEEVKALSADSINNDFVPTDYVGPWGVYLRTGTASFRNVKVRSEPPAAEDVDPALEKIDEPLIPANLHRRLFKP